jgi:hypothetical protein
MTHDQDHGHDVRTGDDPTVRHTADDPACSVCRGELAASEAWECRVCRRAVHAGCCEGRTLERTARGRLSSTCRSCHTTSGEDARPL